MKNALLRRTSVNKDARPIRRRHVTRHTGGAVRARVRGRVDTAAKPPLAAPQYIAAIAL